MQLVLNLRPVHLRRATSFYESIVLRLIDISELLPNVVFKFVTHTFNVFCIHWIQALTTHFLVTNLIFGGEHFFRSMIYRCINSCPWEVAKDRFIKCGPVDGFGVIVIKATIHVSVA